MWTLLTKSYALLETYERRQLCLLVILMIAQACLEVVSIGSILPFMGLLERPEAIHSTWFLEWAYQNFGFTDEFPPNFPSNFRRISEFSAEFPKFPPTIN